MSRKLEVQAEILVKVEEAMLKGVRSQSDVVRIVPILHDLTDAKIYMSAVRKMWNARNINPEETRKELINEIEGIERQLYKTIDSGNGVVKVGGLKTVLDCVKQKADLSGLNQRHIILSKEENPFNDLSDEELQRKLIKSCPDNLILEEYARRFQKTLSGRVEERIIEEP